MITNHLLGTTFFTSAATIGAFCSGLPRVHWGIFSAVEINYQPQIIGQLLRLTWVIRMQSPSFGGRMETIESAVKLYNKIVDNGGYPDKAEAMLSGQLPESDREEFKRLIGTG